MKNNKFLTGLLVATLSLSAISCTNDYLDVNDNPNAIQAEDITPDLMFPGATTQAYRTQAGTMMRFGNLMMNSWAGNSYTFGSPFQREFNLGSVNNTFYAEIWNNLYPRIANYAQIEAFANPDHKQDNYIAMAKIMKAYYMQYIVDLYGDAPYTEAFLGLNNMTPKYDKGSDIYKSLVKSLEEANALLDAADAKALVPTNEDVIYKGNMENWKALSNTIMLRLLVRMHKTTGDMATFRDQKLAALSTRVGTSGSNNGGFISTDAQQAIVNPGYSAANDDSMNPFILNWARNASAALQSNYNLVVVSEHLANVLEGNVILNTPEYTKFTGLKDPRRTRLFINVSSVNSTGNPFTGLKGVRQGALPGEPGAPTTNRNTSKLAAANFSGSTPISTWAGVVTANNTRGGMILSAAEANFLQAEAALRWPALFTFIGSDKFNAGIASNAAWLGANMGSYTTTIATRPGLGWTGTDAQKLEAIMTQKWIALTNVNPTEMFIEYNRTGMPWTPMATTAQKPNKPYRLVYPFSEFAANSSNVPKMTSDDAFIKNQYTPFWNAN